jgi:uncharacterized protein YndB with AHSA1/START domain
MAATPSSAKATFHYERQFAASPERIFHAWTSAEELNLWSAPGPTVARADVDLRVGGRFSIAMEASDGVAHLVRGTYREIDPPRKLVYTWQWESIPGFPETLVTVEFRPRPNGGTDLVLTHEDLPDEDARERHEHGWVLSLGGLSEVVALNR